MVINVFGFHKYYLTRGEHWGNVSGLDIWYDVPNIPFDGGVEGYRIGKSKLKTRLYSWVSLLWTPEYNGDGSFSLEIENTKENRNIKLNDQLMYDEDTSGTIMVITSRQFREGRIVLNGVSLHCYILSNIYSIQSTQYYGVAIRSSAAEFIYELIAPFFQLTKLYNPSAATAPHLPPISGFDCVSADAINRSYAEMTSAIQENGLKWDRGVSAWEFIRDSILKPCDIGFGASFLPEEYINTNRIDPRYGNIIAGPTDLFANASKSGGWVGFYVKKPGNFAGTFSKKMGNISDEVYTESEANYANDATVYVGDNLKKLGFSINVGYPATSYTPHSIHFPDGKKTGSVTRRNVLIDASNEEPQGYDKESQTYTETEVHYIERMRQLALAQLSDQQLVQNWRFTIIDPENRVKLGDMIKIASDYTDDIFEARVVSISYKSQDGHTTRTLSVGTPVPRRRR